VCVGGGGGNLGFDAPKTHSTYFQIRVAKGRPCLVVVSLIARNTLARSKHAR
jgi:hypothetical protein